MAATSSAARQHPYLCQVAFSVTDLERTHRFYRNVFGFLPAGGTRLFRGPLASRIQGLPRAASTCWWLLDQQDFRQLEMFQFQSPQPRPYGRKRRPCDIGYTMLGLHVRNFSEVMGKLEMQGVRPLTEPVYHNGKRRVCIRDPEGVLLELMEDDPRISGAPSRVRPEVPVAARCVTVSVPDLQKARQFWIKTLGCTEAYGFPLHRPEHEAMWGLPGARARRMLVWAGDFLIELVQYEEPQGRPVPEGYRLSDQGILNIALGFRDRKLFDMVYKRVIANGYSSNCRPMHFGTWKVVYCTDDQGLSVELLYCSSWADRWLGFRPKPIKD